MALPGPSFCSASTSTTRRATPVPIGSALHPDNDHPRGLHRCGPRLLLARPPRTGEGVAGSPAGTAATWTSDVRLAGRRRWRAVAGTARQPASRPRRSRWLRTAASPGRTATIRTRARPRRRPTVATLRSERARSFASHLQDPGDGTSGQAARHLAGFDATQAGSCGRSSLSSMRSSRNKGTRTAGLSFARPRPDRPLPALVRRRSVRSSSTVDRRTEVLTSQGDSVPLCLQAKRSGCGITEHRSGTWPAGTPSAPTSSAPVRPGSRCSILAAARLSPRAEEQGPAHPSSAPGANPTARNSRRTPAGGPAGRSLPHECCQLAGTFGVGDKAPSRPTLCRL